MSTEQAGDSVPRLVQIMRRLLAPDGCPWDREQTLESLRAYVIEEAFEVVDAIETGDPAELCEELGDLLLQIVFQAELAQRQGWFGIDDVVQHICDKLVRRHPHVFSDAQVHSAGEVVDNWEKLKAREKAGRGALEGVPRALPALLRALRSGEKAARLGYDWPDASGPRAKVDEELQELDRAVDQGDAAARTRELGDVLFSLANWARKQGIDPEAALRETLDRFAGRVARVEARARQSGRALSEMSADERDALWEELK